MVAEYRLNRDLVGTVWINFAVCKGRYDTYAPLFISLLGAKPVITAAWKGLLSGAGRLVHGDVEIEATYRQSLCACPVRTFGEAAELTIYDKSVFVPWSVNGYAVSILAFGATEEAARDRFFGVLDRVSSIPLAREWADELWQAIPAMAGCSVTELIFFGENEELRKQFAVAKLVDVQGADGCILQWLDEKYSAAAA